MAVSDALVVGEAWISEHYFTTDATKQSFHAKVLERRKAWEADKESGTVRTRFSAARGELLGILTRPDDGEQRLGALYKQIETILGYDGLGLIHSTNGPVTRINAAGLAGPGPLAIVHAREAESVEDLLAKDAATLLDPYPIDETTSLSSVSRALSHLFTSPDHPDFALVLAGGLILVAERERWAEGRYLLVDLQLVCERSDDKRGGEVDRTLTILEAGSLGPDADGNIWWREVLDESVKHTVGVSSDLREGVRLSIEIIANDVVERRRLLGMERLPDREAQPLARQALRFLYRILFLLYAEASPELGVLPIGAPEYERGYSLDRLRDLTLVELTTMKAEHGTHLYESLQVLFRLVDQGHDGEAADDLHDGLTFRSLRADLFRPEATAHIDEVGLSNGACQRVLRHLLLSKEKRGADRGFISYAELGINQLGAVYEGLMSYTGFFAGEDLYEVAKGGDSSKGSWVVPVERAAGISADDFVKAEDPVTGERKPVLHHRGRFVFRLAGRERQQSASYYTPEVLTRFVVSQSLEELLDQEGTTTPAREILDLTICEPALGSGAFAIEAVRQLAEQYLTRRQAELGERIDPDEYPRELQRVKAYLALHQTYGVDLNATAVELAEISLWLDTMVEGLSAPWFGLHLRRGNSLIGARRATYSRSQVEKRTWLKDVPADLPMAQMPDDIAEGRDGVPLGRIHHFLLPADGWGSAVGAKEAKALAPDGIAALRGWRRAVLAKPSKKQVDALVGLARRVEVLWQFAYQRLGIAESEIRRSVDVWGATDLPSGGAVTREQIEASLANGDSAYRRLRLVMDAWTALWFWPLTEDVQAPTLEQWIDALQRVLGVAAATPRKHNRDQLSLASVSAWDDLTTAVENDLSFAGARSVDRVIADHPWLAVCQRIAAEQGFFHWELDFAPVFARGGFDLQVGNPPWVRPRSDVDALMAEGDPWWQLAVKPTQTQVAAKRETTLALPGMPELVLQGTTDVACIAAFVGAPTEYPHLAGLQPDLYRCFMEQTWRHARSMDVAAGAAGSSGTTAGFTGLIHLESHFTDEQAGPLRAETYRRLRRHWQFINELELFEIQNQKRYGVSVFGAPGEPDFIQAASLYHPDMVERSLRHDGSGPEPGMKDLEGAWDVRPHRSRIVRVTDRTLRSWHAALEVGDIRTTQTRMVYAVNKSTAEVLEKLAAAPRLSQLNLCFSPGWHEKNDRTKGFFDSEWGTPDAWNSVILQGPHLFVANPFYKSPNSTMLHHRDWTEVDLESLPADAVPTTSYKPRGPRSSYDAAYTHWSPASPNDHATPARDHYRVAWRTMAANTGERTLIPAIIPPGAGHVDGLYSLGIPSDPRTLVCIAASLGSLLSDFAVRVAPKSTIRSGTIARLPRGFNEEVSAALSLRVLRLNCLTSAYAELWSKVFSEAFFADSWAISATSGVQLEAVSSTWTSSTPLRRQIDRRAALIEIDALVAVALEISAEELGTVYRTHFPVLFGYDNQRPAHLHKLDREGADSDSTTRQASQSPDQSKNAGKWGGSRMDRVSDLAAAHAEFVRRARIRERNTS